MGKGISNPILIAGVALLLIAVFLFLRSGEGVDPAQGRFPLANTYPASSPTPSVKVPIAGVPTSVDGIEGARDDASLAVVGKDGGAVELSKGSSLGSGICGDDLCSVYENCLSCREDCGCVHGEACGENGVCALKVFCGDGVCSNSEINNQSCCSDCGCWLEETCNGVTNECVAALKISTTELDAIAQREINNTGGNMSVFQIRDGIYQGKVVKEIILYCPDTSFECSEVLIIDGSKTVIARLITE
ncbi:MAG: hypothetical protein V1835_00885 [Candidatus Micrarchaeota archaeon]